MPRSATRAPESLAPVSGPTPDPPEHLTLVALLVRGTALGSGQQPSGEPSQVGKRIGKGAITPVMLLVRWSGQGASSRTRQGAAVRFLTLSSASFSSVADMPP